uniref:ATP-dependent Clp protease proteolytic subunit n=1 Tax=Entransia fimbriata TaxID=130991 RepID=A0A191T4M8_9VIRI|nr:proteolytic subunit 2 of clp protease [Entransia fimbriata]ANI25353.1 proteolytic subunit 2 of clp protease [Entransia fimbriata]WKT05763.1 proteolytic subunit 2 of clp protease [Entransia fimbriata]WKT05882.1 proteolytic subunit 2 of clp protease [Entransia fimbriata]
MPIGVPKVPYLLPGEENAMYIDIYNLLYRERILFLAQKINDEISNQLVGIMVYLSSENDQKDMYLYINCPGGSVLAGLAVYDAMNYIEPKVTTICMGMAMSMGSFILAGGETGKRVALPHGRIMIHQPSSGYFDTQASEFCMEASEVLRIREEITRIYSSRTGQKPSIISEDMERDVFMSADEAKEYGLVDQVVVHMESIPWMEGS